MPEEAPHVVIIGGGFGGLAAAQALKRAPVRITLLDRRNHHLFQPLLYQVATAGLSPGNIAAPIRWILRRQQNVRVLLAAATAIDPATRTVTLNEGSITYDYLIVATGATHAYFGHPEWEAFAPGLKSLDDALEIRRRMLLAYEIAEREEDPDLRRRLLTFAVIGGGPTGVEMAGAIAEIARHTLAHEFRSISTEQSRVVLIEGGPSILSTFPEDLRNAARRSLERLRVEVWENTLVTSVDKSGVAMGERRLEAGTVIWAAGVAASPLARSLGVPLDRVGRVAVEPELHLRRSPRAVRDRRSCALQGCRRAAAPRCRPRCAAAGAARRTKHRAAHQGAADAAVRLSRPRDDGDHRPRRRDCEARTRPPVRIDRVAGLAVRTHHEPGRVPQPRPGAHPVGGRVHLVPAERAVDYRARSGPGAAAPASECSGCPAPTGQRSANVRQ